MDGYRGKGVVCRNEKLIVCRVPGTAPCSFLQAHDKLSHCRVLEKKLTTNKGHTTNNMFAVFLEPSARQSLSLSCDT